MVYQQPSFEKRSEQSEKEERKSRAKEGEGRNFKRAHGEGRNQTNGSFSAEECLNMVMSRVCSVDVQMLSQIGAAIVWMKLFTFYSVKYTWCERSAVHWCCSSRAFKKKKKRNRQRSKILNHTVPGFLESGFYPLAVLTVVTRAHLLNKQGVRCLWTTKINKTSPERTFVSLVK